MPAGADCRRAAGAVVQLLRTIGIAHGRLWHEWDLRAAPTNVRSWESNGLNADVVFGPFMTHRDIGQVKIPQRSSLFS